METVNFLRKNLETLCMRAFAETRRSGLIAVSKDTVFK